MTRPADDFARFRDIAEYVHGVTLTMPHTTKTCETEVDPVRHSDCPCYPHLSHYPSLGQETSAVHEPHNRSSNTFGSFPYRDLTLAIQALDLTLNMWG